MRHGMSKAKLKPRIRRRKVTFSLEEAEANEVILMGDFNNWNPNVHTMKMTETAFGASRSIFLRVDTNTSS